MNKKFLFSVFIFINFVFGAISTIYSQTISQPEMFFSEMEKAYKAGNYEAMLEMTANESIELYGRDKILNLYRSNLAFFSNIAFVRTEKDGNDTIAIYEIEVWGMRIYSSVLMVFENDSYKVVLNSLEGLWLRAFQSGV